VIHAYGTYRSFQRKSVSGETRHALDDIAHLCGALDALCGTGVAVRIGEWDPDEPQNCSKCTRMLAREVAA
jgi:hypothetical protein